MICMGFRFSPAPLAAYLLLFGLIDRDSFGVRLKRIDIPSGNLWWGTVNTFINNVELRPFLVLPSLKDKHAGRNIAVWRGLLIPLIAYDLKIRRDGFQIFRCLWDHILCFGKSIGCHFTLQLRDITVSQRCCKLHRFSAILFRGQTIDDILIRTGRYQRQRHEQRRKPQAKYIFLHAVCDPNFYHQCFLHNVGLCATQRR